MSKEIVLIEGQVTFFNQVTVSAEKAIDMGLQVGKATVTRKILKELLLQNAREGTRKLLRGEEKVI